MTQRSAASTIKHIAFIGNYLPRQCGIATFTTDLYEAVAALPAIVARYTNVVYMIVGATHPRVLSTEGETYRLLLQRLAQEQGVLVLFRDSAALTAQAIDLLDNESKRHAMRKRAYLFGRVRFDQQPVEAQAMASACLEVYRSTGDIRWRTEARRTFEWFLGRNDLNQPLYDPTTGGCCDGLHSDRGRLAVIGP